MLKRALNSVFTVFTVTLVALTASSMFRPVEFDLSRYDRIDPSRRPATWTELDTHFPVPNRWQMAVVEDGVLTLLFSDSNAPPSAPLTSNLTLDAHTTLALDWAVRNAEVNNRLLNSHLEKCVLTIEQSGRDPYDREATRRENLLHLEFLAKPRRDFLDAANRALYWRTYFFGATTAPSRQFVCRFPLWHFAVPLALVHALVLLRGPWRMRRRRRRRKRGLCLNCGYDLTGNCSGVCPECGTQVGAALPIDQNMGPR